MTYEIDIHIVQGDGTGTADSIQYSPTTVRKPAILQMFKVVSQLSMLHKHHNILYLLNHYHNFIVISYFFFSLDLLQTVATDQLATEIFAGMKKHLAALDLLN